MIEHRGYEPKLTKVATCQNCSETIAFAVWEGLMDDGGHPREWIHVDTRSRHCASAPVAEPAPEWNPERLASLRREALGR